MAVVESEEKRYVVSTFYGGSGGDYWDDGLYDGVRKITVRSASWINSIVVEYYRKGETIKAQKHGGNGGGEFVMPLGPDEFLTSVSGYVDMVKVRGDPVLLIRSLKFETNLQPFKSIGEEVGKPFSFSVKDGEKISGFIGRATEYVDAIGLHITHS